MRSHITVSNVKGVIAVAVAVVLANCVIQQSPAPSPARPLSNRAQGDEAMAMASGSVPLAGAYKCSFKQGNYQYPPFPCRVTTRRDGRVMLDKLAGSQRISGEVTRLGDRQFRFQGVFYCPYGACTEDVSAEFDTIEHGVYRGAMHTSTGTTWVLLEHLPGGFGGKMYGGNVYGGSVYGGNLYGGSMYGALKASAPRKTISR